MRNVTLILMSPDIKIISHSDPLYPPLLKEIAQPPPQLYIRGNPEVLQHPYLLAVVGSRRHSHYARQATEKILPPLVQNGVVLVSGFARGVDTLAHQACLDGNRPTVAVLGSGLNNEVVYPASNRLLIEKIIRAGGCLVSEYAPDRKALPAFFPARNRLIAGLTRATLIIQAAQKSGSLITARLALDANRDVAAVPGPITDPLSAGTNYLLQQGAHLVTSANDLLPLLGLETTAVSPAIDISQLSLEQASILKHLTAEPQHVDSLIQTTQLEPQLITGLLLELELLGCVEHLGGMNYVKK